MTSHLDDREAVLIDVAVHALAITMAMDGMIALAFDPAIPAAVALYLSIVMAMFLFSMAYNLSRLWWLRRLDHASIAVLAMTMIAVLALGSPMLVTLALFILGGIIYLFGLPFLNWSSLRFHNAIWHCFVTIAASFHYVALLGRN